MSYVGSGTLGNGLFGLYLRDIVLNEYKEQAVLDAKALSPKSDPIN